MSIVRANLDKWLKSQQPEKVSVLRQAVVCDRFSAREKTKMFDIAEESRDKLLEMGAPIRYDYTLGDVVTGTKYEVSVPHPPGTIGTYHTHPYGFAMPSGMDILTALVQGDEVMCVGKSGYTATRVACYTMRPEWELLRDEAVSLDKEIAEFNERIKRKYPGWKGGKLRKLLRDRDHEEWSNLRDLETKREKLMDKAEEKYPIPADCSFRVE